MHFAGALAVACILPACSKDEQRTSCPVQVNVSFSGFEIRTDASGSRSVRTKATPADSAGVSGIAFAVVDAEGEIVYSAQQSHGSEDFGAVSFELTEGTYTFAAEAHIFSDVATISVSGGGSGGSGGSAKAIATISGSAVYETFAASEQVTVTAGEDVDLKMTLSRISAQLSLETKDNQPSGVATLQFFIGDTLKPAYTAFSIDLATGTMADFGVGGHLAREWGRNSIDAGKPTTQSCALLLAAEQQSLPVKIVVLDASGEVLRSHTIPSVPFRQNCTTTLTGEFYSTPAASSFQFDTGWGTPIDGGW